MINKIKNNPSAFIYRSISLILSSLILPNIFLLLFIVYMNYGHFFSYDFFDDGIFGMKLFFVMTIVIVFIMSLIFSGSIIIFIGNKKSNYKIFEDSNTWWWIYLLNISSIILSILLIISSKLSWQWFLFIFIISLVVCIHLSILIFYDVKVQLLSFITSMSIIIFLFISFPKEEARLLSLALKSFGVGGYINTELKVKNGEVKKGKLILLSPKTVYFQPNGNKGIEILSLNNIEDIFISNTANGSIDK